MELVSVNVGQPAPLAIGNETVQSAIVKRPVAGHVHVARLNVAGDRQGAPEFHGGEHMAVYAFPTEHYPHWCAWLGVASLPWGAFGENLSVSGLDETALQIGDELTIGTVRLQVSQPRVPCARLGARHGRRDLLKAFVGHGRPGFYCRVLEEGELAAGDTIADEGSSAGGPTVAEVFALRFAAAPDPDACARVAACDALSPTWREWFGERAS